MANGMSSGKAMQLLVELYGKYTRYTHDHNYEYETAVSMACAALQNYKGGEQHDDDGSS